MLTFDSRYVPSLQSIVLVKIASELWNHRNIRLMTLSILRSTIPERRALFIKNNWNSIQNEVLCKTRNLPLTSYCITDVQRYVYGMGWHIFIWMIQHSKVLKITLPKKFFFTIRGCLDEKKIAKFIVRDQRLPANEKFKIACAYCLKEKIIELSQQLKQEPVLNVMCSCEPEYSLVIYWELWLQKCLGQSMRKTREFLHSAETRTAILHSARKLNKAAFYYFWKNLDPETKSEFATELIDELEKYAWYIDYNCMVGFLNWANERSEVLCCFLSLIDKDQKKCVIASHPHCVLKSLLHWPWQRYFIEAAALCWERLHEIQYLNLLKIIIHEKITVDLNDYDYRKLLCEFWYHSPDNFKKSVVKTNASDVSVISWIYLMCLVNNELYVRMTIRDMSPKMKHEMIFSKLGQHIFREICKKKNLLHYFLMECISSREEFMEFNHYISELHYQHDAEKQPVWVHLLNMLENIFLAYAFLPF